MSFTTYREQQSHSVSSHMRSAVLDASFPAEQNCYLTAKRSQRYSKVLDICLVALWGVSIPGLMWLGAYSGL